MSSSLEKDELLEDISQCVGGICLMPPPGDGDGGEEEEEEASSNIDTNCFASTTIDDTDGGDDSKEGEHEISLSERTPTEDDNKEEDKLPSSSDTKKTNNNSNNKKKKKKNSSSIISKVHSQKELDIMISTHDIVIVEFMTSWCGACKGIEPLFEELATNTTTAVTMSQQQQQQEDDDNTPSFSIQSVQVICDKNKETKKLASFYGIGSYPVFIIFENGQQTTTWKGADRGKLEKTFERFVSGGSGSGRKKGRRKGSHKKNG